MFFSFVGGDGGRVGKLSILFLDICYFKIKYDWDILKTKRKKEFPGGTLDEKEGFEDQLWYLDLKFEIDFQDGFEKGLL